MLRLFVSIFFQVFYIASLSVFLVAFDCDWFSGSPYKVAAFPAHGVCVCVCGGGLPCRRPGG